MARGDKQAIRKKFSDSSNALFNAAWRMMLKFENDGGVVDDQEAFIDWAIGKLVNNPNSTFYIYG